MTDLTDNDRTPARRRSYLTLLIVALLLAVELFAVSLAYRHGFVFECRAVAPAMFCGALSASVLRAISVVGVLILVLLARPALRRALGEGLRREPDQGWLAVQIAGFALVMAPLLFVADGVPGAIFALGVASWLGGGALAVAGALLGVAPARVWRDAARAAGPALGVIVAVALTGPELASLFQWAWRWEPITAVTFSATAGLLRALGQDVVANPEIVELGIEPFVVLVGRQCSGVEGFALISSFLGFCLWLFRDQLRFPHVLVLLPIGIVVSWCFNVLRIAALVMIGAHVSPDLAINGFHSHAGWLLFTVLALTLAVAATRVPWFRREPLAVGAPVQAARTVRPPLFADPVAMMILPFVVFTASALLASTFSATPAFWYPLRLVAMLAVLLPFRRLILAMAWRVDPAALAGGAVIGVLWLATTGSAETDLALAAAIAGMGPALFALWAVTRIAGTAFVVPLIEELFFRGYLLGRLDRGGWAMRIVALLVSSGLFALLHDRWLAAGLAGLVFGLLALRRGRLADAIVAHAAANALIAAWAVASGDWTVI